MMSFFIQKYVSRYFQKNALSALYFITRNSNFQEKIIIHSPLFCGSYSNRTALYIIFPLIHYHRFLSVNLF